MLATHWLDRTAAANGLLDARLSDARDALSSTIDRGNRALADGLDASRALGETLFGNARRVARSTRDRIDGHPLETMVLVGVAAFAIGWLARRMSEPRPRSAARKTSASTPQPARRRARAGARA